jgi:hypothetical protein
MKNVWWFAGGVGKAVALLGAFSCYYAALLLYPDEEGRIKNKLEEWWITFDDRQLVALSAASVFMRGLATLLTGLINFMFGHKLSSFRAISVSAWLSLTCMSFGVVILNLNNDMHWSVFHLVVAVILVLSIGYSWVRILATCLIVSQIGIMWAVAFGVYTDWGFMGEGRFALPLSMMFVVGVLSDFSFIAFTRKLLALCEEMTVAAASMALFAANVILGFMLFVIPLAIRSKIGLQDLALFDTALALSNGFDFVLSAALVLVALMLLLHRIFWPLAARIVYTVTPTTVRKGLLLTTGSILLTGVFGRGTMATVVDRILGAW